MPRALLLALLVTAAGCAHRAPADAAPEPPVHAFACDGLRFTVQFRGETARVALPDRTFDLPGAVSASGARYSDGATTFWEHQGEASLEVDGRTYRGCTRA
jgi:membrane-bound inhibitor of C-type lysozyme